MPSIHSTVSEVGLYMFNSSIRSTVSEVGLYIVHRLHTQALYQRLDLHCSAPQYTALYQKLDSAVHCSTPPHTAVEDVLSKSLRSRTQDHNRRRTGPQSTQSTQSGGPVSVLKFCSISIILLASLVAGRRSQCTAGAVQQEMYSTIPIHWNIKSAPVSPGRSRVGPALYVFSLLGQDCTEIYNTIHKTVSEGGLKIEEGNAVICSPVSENGL